MYLHAQSKPAAPAVITGTGEIISYAQLGVLVSRMAGYFRTCDITPGQVVGISMSDNPLHLIVILALAQLGAVSLPLHPEIPAARRALAAQRFAAVCVISGRNEMALEGLTFINVSQVLQGERQAADISVYAVHADDPLRIIISSGTSGDPKAMLLTHGNLALRTATTEAGASALSRVLPLDLNFIAGFRPTISALQRGATLVFPLGMTAEHILLALITQKVSHVYFSPFHARTIAELIGANVVQACPDLLCLRIGGGAINAALLKLVQQRITANVFISYGSTESGMVTYATPEMLSRHPDTVGSVCPYAEVEITGTNGKILPAGCKGEIRVRSSHQVTGYLSDEERSRKHFRGDWFYPGDTGYFADSGLLYIEGRLDNLLNFGGMKLNPQEIEAVLKSHPSVIDAAVFISTGNAGREELLAALELKNNDSLPEIDAYARSKLGPLAPSRYVPVSALPRTVTGKVKYSEVNAQLQ